VHEGSVRRILAHFSCAAVVAAASLAVGACAGESGTGPGDAYAYDIVYEQREGLTGDPDLYVLSLETDETSRVLAPGVSGMQPATSPSGSQIAFVRTDAEFESQSEIFTVTRSAGGDFGTLTNVSNNSAADMMPAWSADGQRLAFVTSRTGSIDDIFVMDAGGSNVRRVTVADDAAGVVTTEWWPAWSPVAPQRIAYSSTIDGTADIWTTTVDATTVQRARLTSTADNDYHPSWSHDGARIAFHRIDQNTGDADIMILSVDTGLLERIAMPGQQLWPAWSPEGDLIAFSSNHEGEDFEIYTMTIDGSDVLRRTDNGVNDLRPAWLLRPVE